MPTYNRAEWLPISIGSVLEQTYRDWELIVWNDGSHDHTSEVVNSFKDSRIRYYYFDNRGKSVALNQALMLAKGKYIAFLDDDDQWFPEKLAAQVDIMEAHAEIDLLFTNFYNIDKTLNQKIASFNYHRKLFNKLIKREISQNTYLITSGIPELLLIYSFVLPSTVLIKIGSIEKIGQFNELLRNAQDLEYWWRLGLNGIKFAFIDKIFVNRNKLTNSLSNSNTITMIDRIRTLDYCFKEAKDYNRQDLYPYIKKAYHSTWLVLFRSYVILGERKQAIWAFINSLKYGISWRVSYLLIGVFLGPKLFNQIVAIRDKYFI